ncbi:zinc finger protein 831 [Tiliqua scincoides]|uniref:zinc finger protein 831 n=1 Tax=Tiliqua scincoides TaxID=71010 RepID=UPI0034623895
MPHSFCLFEITQGWEAALDVEVAERKLMENIKEMEAQRHPCPPVSDDQLVQLSCLQTIPAAPNLSLSPVILQPEQALSQTIYVKALTIPFYQPIQSECLQRNSQLPTSQTSINLESSNVPLILSPLLSSERADQPQALAQKQPRTISIVSGLPVLSQTSSSCASLGSPGRTKSAGKYLCKHCGRDCLKPSVLEKHMRSHTGERPFPCTTCGIAFKTQSNLYKHRRTQTHVNNARLPSESDCSSPLKENEKVIDSGGSPQTTKANNRYCDNNSRAATKQAISESTGVITSEKHPLKTSLSAASALSLVSESRWMTTDSSYNGGANQSEKEAMKDPEDPPQRTKIQEQRSPTVRHSQLQRQQATYSEKLWDSRSPDCKLKKCESTDSGYLSRSESVEQQMLSPSPLHSVCKHSTESEGETTPGNSRCTAGNSSRVDLAEKAAATSTLEKKKLEEHISKLISQNKAVVDDSQLDNVRPRKTVLSKQGSIDLPMPYTYKDSFHFDIRSLDTNRKKNLSLCSAKSIFTPVEKPKPLFFYSVPTQFSTTIDCVPVTRSNSLPFVESTRRMQEQVDSSKLSSFTRMPPNTGFSGLLHGNNFATGTAESPNSHPRALVRQVAVDDLPQSRVIESLPSVEEMKNPKKPGAGGEGANSKGKKSSQRKLKMFSQEKWQVYGDETFKKIYQKMKSNQVTKKPKGNKIADTSNLPSDIKETAICEAITVPRDGRSSIARNLVTSPVAISPKINSEESESHSIGSPLSQSASSQESSSSFAEFTTASYSVRDCERSGRTKTLFGQRCQELHVLKLDPSGNSQALPLSTSGELRFQLCCTKGQAHHTLLTAANQQRCSDESEEKCLPGERISTSIGEDTRGKESYPLAQVAVPLLHSNSSELVQEPQKLPSERKKLKVDELKSKEKVMLRVSLDPNNSAGRIVELLDHYKIINIAPVLSVNHSVKGEKQTVVAGTNTPGSSMECENGTQHPPRPSSEREDSAHNAGPASASALSFSEHLTTEITSEYFCSSYTVQKVTEKACSMITETRMSSQSGATTPTLSPIQPQVLDQVTPHPKRNEFLPKYILKYPKEGNTGGMPLIIAGKQENISCISLPSTSAATPYPSSNNSSLDTKATDVFLCPPTILETTNITTRVDGRRPQQIAGLEMKDAWKGTNNGDNSDDEQPMHEGGGSAMVLSSRAPEKKICFTSMYTGGFFISSDMTGRSSALQIIHSGSSSIISVSSLVERAALCGDTDKEMKEWDSDANAFPALQGLPSCSVSNSRCLCHSSDMLYCHVLCTQQKDVHTLSRLSLGSRAGNAKIPSLIPFPTLNAEPQLTWCCLTKNLPVEQKEKEDSAYFSLHTCRNENAILKGSCSLYKVKKSRRPAGEGMIPGPSKAPPAFLQKQQIEKLNFPTARGDELLENIAEQEKARGTLCKTRELTAHKAKRGCKRRKVKINHRRYKGNCVHKHIPLKTSRLSKQYWLTNRAVDTPKRLHSRPHRPGSHKCCGKCPCLPTTSQGNNPCLQQEASCNIADKAAFHVPKKNWMKEDVSKPTNEQSSDILSLQGIAVVPAVPMASYSSALASSLDVCSLGKLQKEPWSDTPPDHSWPSTGICSVDFIDTGKIHSHQNVGSEVTSPIFAELKTDCKDAPHAEPKCQSVTVLKPPVPITGSKVPAGEDLSPSFTEQLAPTFQTSCPISFGSKMFSEPSASSNCLPVLRHVEETSNSTAYLECSDKNSSFVQPDDQQGEPCETGLPAFRKVSANSGILPRSFKKQSLEMTNKQTCVEYDDTSSDDEDRLIIEI